MIKITALRKIVRTPSKIRSLNLTLYWNPVFFSGHLSVIDRITEFDRIIIDRILRIINTNHINDSSLQMDSKDLSRVYKSLNEVKCGTGSYIPRDDYAEFLDLVIFYLKKDSFNTFRFRQLGTQHRARWMSSAIHTLKMLLLHNTT